MVTMTKPWTGKKDSLPSYTKKEQHKNRKTYEHLIHLWQEDDWEQQLRDYKNKNADQPIQE